jgi:hypothetical protein
VFLIKLNHSFATLSEIKCYLLLSVSP